jgi:hypothetical protein
MGDLSSALPRDHADTFAAPSSVPVVLKPQERPQESSDDYPDIVVMIDPKTRVIAADIQWIIQKRRREGRRAWEGVYYCRSKEGLLLYAPKPTAPELLALPDWFPEPEGPLAWNI